MNELKSELDDIQKKHPLDGFVEKGKNILYTDVIYLVDLVRGLRFEGVKKLSYKDMIHIEFEDKN